MAASITELWRLALPPTTVLHAEPTSPALVRAVVTLRPTQPALPSLHQGEVVLVSTALLSALDPRLTLGRLIERLQGATVIAILMIGPVDQVAISAARQAGIGLFALPGETDIRVVQREIERLFSDREAQLERRAAQLYAALTRGNFGADGRDELLAILERWIGAPVAFPAQADAKLTYPVVVANRRMGMLGASQDGPWERLALEQGAIALALLLDRERAIEDRVRGNVIEALLSGVPLDTAAQLRARDQGLNLDVPHSLLALRPIEPSPLDRIQAASRRILERLRRQGLVAEHGGTLVVALPINKDEDPEEEARTIHASLVQSGFQLDGGFGFAREPLDWATAWHEALSGLQLGRELLGGGKLAGAAELGVYRLLLAISDADVAQQLYQRTIAALVDHDQRQDGDLLTTLQMFFAYIGNHSQAAAALHIHRNTLLYRLGRIHAITGHRLDQAADRLALQVGLALHRIYQSQRTYKGRSL